MLISIVMPLFMLADAPSNAAKAESEKIYEKPIIHDRDALLKCKATAIAKPATDTIEAWSQIFRTDMQVAKIARDKADTAEAKEAAEKDLAYASFCLGTLFTSQFEALPKEVEAAPGLVPGIAKPKSFKADRFTYRSNGDIIASNGSVVSNASSCLLPIDKRPPETVAGSDDAESDKKVIARMPRSSPRAELCGTEHFRTDKITTDKTD